MRHVIVMIVLYKRFRLLVSLLPFRGLSICLSLTFVHWAQMAENIDMISFVYNSLVSLPDRFKIWFTSIDPLLSKFCPKVTHPLLI